VEAEERVDALDPRERVRGVVAGHALERVHPDVDARGELAAESVDLVQVLAEADDARREARAARDRLLAASDELRARDLGRVERRPEADLRGVRALEEVHRAREVRLDRGALDVGEPREADE